MLVEGWEGGGGRWLFALGKWLVGPGLSQRCHQQPDITNVWFAARALLNNAADSCEISCEFAFGTWYVTYVRVMQMQKKKKEEESAPCGAPPASELVLPNWLRGTRAGLRPSLRHGQVQELFLQNIHTSQLTLWANWSTVVCCPRSRSTLKWSSQRLFCKHVFVN